MSEDIKKKMIITIGRELGSGGREIGGLVADKLGIKYYDRELLAVVAKESGFCEEFLTQHDEVPAKSFLYSLVMGGGHAVGHGNFGHNTMPLEQRVFLAQFDAIRKLADSENFVIVGRCADYALEGRAGVMSVFIHAPREYRIKRISTRHNIPINEAEDLVNKTDKRRASYYNYYTNKKWGAASGYDLSINGSLMDKEKIAAIIADIAKNAYNYS